MKRIIATALMVLSLTLGYICAVQAQTCYQTSIVKPTPFMGNNDEIFVLSDGSIWQVKYEYSYLYEYYPSVIMCPSQGRLMINNKKLNVVNLSNSKNLRGNSGGVIQSRIDGEFKGWEGDTIYKLMNGQIWQQSSYHYHYHYAYSPEVIIYESGGSYKMKVDGDDDEPISVRRLN